MRIITPNLFGSYDNYLRVAPGLEPRGIDSVRTALPQSWNPC